MQAVFNYDFDALNTDSPVIQVCTGGPCILKCVRA